VSGYWFVFYLIRYEKVTVVFVTINEFEWLGCFYELSVTMRLNQVAGLFLQWFFYVFLPQYCTL